MQCRMLEQLAAVENEGIFDVVKWKRTLLENVMWRIVRTGGWLSGCLVAVVEHCWLKLGALGFNYCWRPVFHFPTSNASLLPTVAKCLALGYIVQWPLPPPQQLVSTECTSFCSQNIQFSRVTSFQNKQTSRVLVSFQETNKQTHLWVLTIHQQCCHANHLYRTNNLL